MSVAGIETVVTTKFLAALARSGGAVTSRTGKTPSDSDKISVALKTGLKAYVAAVQGLNTAASFVNLARTDLAHLKDLVVEMKDLAARASKAGTGSQARSEADNRIQTLGKQFEKYVASAKFQGNNYLTTDGLSGLLTNFGLDEASSQTISDSFEQFQTTDQDTALASEFAKPDTSILIPEDAYTSPVSVSRQTKVDGELFDTERRLKNRPDAYRFLRDLSGLEKQIEKNDKALEHLGQVVGENLKLARATGLAFLDQSNSQIENPQEAEEVARQLRMKIRANAGAAVSQADNLEAITVASLLLSQSNSDG